MTIDNNHSTYMQTISAGQFKTHCLKLMDEVAMHSEEIIITKRGKPIVKMVPLSRSHEPFGAIRDAITINGDIVNCDFTTEWEALKDE